MKKNQPIQPTKAGWYWVQLKKHPEWIIVHVFRPYKRWPFVVSGTRLHCEQLKDPEIFQGAKWYGPISKPKL